MCLDAGSSGAGTEREVVGDVMSPTRIADALEPALRSFAGPDCPVRFEFWDNSSTGSADAKSAVLLRSPEAFSRILWSPNELGIARAFVMGDIDIHGDAYHAFGYLTNLVLDPKVVGVRTLVTAAKQMRPHGARLRNLPSPPEEIVPPGRRHSKRRDASAVTHHYDVGNDFYRLVLGESMTYSCARFVQPGQLLPLAQTDKYDLVARKLGLHGGARLLDVGCGWGGMLMHAAQHYGVQAVGITLSNEQATYARERVAESGMQHRIEVRVQDYRDLRGETFDAVSSIGMFEHVGRARMAEYFAALHAVLAPGGRLLNHAIDKPKGSAMAAKGFIARYVFPDGELQDLAETVAAMQDAGFEVRDVESLREHYALTLRHWVGNLEGQWDDAVALVGERRARVWWAYMIGSAVSFEGNRISIHQSLGTKTLGDGTSNMPMTRHAYI
jgi:cyclopropane-fatty-acyl-phospholipid synthase